MFVATYWPSATHRRHCITIAIMHYDRYVMPRCGRHVAYAKHKGVACMSSTEIGKAGTDKSHTVQGLPLVDRRELMKGVAAMTLAGAGIANIGSAHADSAAHEMGVLDA